MIVKAHARPDEESCPSGKWGWMPKSATVGQCTLPSGGSGMVIWADMGGVALTFLGLWIGDNDGQACHDNAA